MASPTARRVVWTGAIASVTVVGTVCGALLKNDREAIQEAEVLRETSVDERIGLLQARKARLLIQRDEFQKKVDEIEARAKTVEPSGH